MATKESICFGCDTVQHIDAALASARCNCGGNLRPLLSLNAFRAARLAHRLGTGYYVHSAIVDFAASVDSHEPINWNNTREAIRKDGTKHIFAFDHYLREASENAKTKADLDRVWIAGSLLALGETLKDGKKYGEKYDKDGYFDRAPILELVYHFRNAVAHGNKFNIINQGRKRLRDHPAHNRDAAVKSPSGFIYEVTAATEGPLLFEFMGPADFVDLFMSVEVHLFSLAVA